MYYDFHETQPRDEKFGTHNEGLGICPIMSRQGKPCYCTKDCPIMENYHCPFSTLLTRRTKRQLKRLEKQLEDGL